MECSKQGCDHKRGRIPRRSSAITVCQCCRDFLCSICGTSIEWHEGLGIANPAAKWRYCSKEACIKAEARYHGMPVDEMIRHRHVLRAKRVSRHFLDRGIAVRPPPSATHGTPVTAGSAQRIFTTQRTFSLGLGEACWCNLGKDCCGDHELYLGAPVHRCALCGQAFLISPEDLHWSTGQCSICPSATCVLP